MAENSSRAEDELEVILEFSRREIERASQFAPAQYRDLNRIRLVAPAALYRHLDNAISVRRYQRKADQIAAIINSGRLLDWGSFCGQMTYLLMNRGVDAVPFDIEENRLPSTLNDVLARPTLYSTDLVRLPFDDASFDAVLSCGTLEHVADPASSLLEVGRVLRPGGRLFIYNLPNILSWIEAINWMRGDAHDRRYFMPAAKAWLRKTGFSVDLSSYENVLPCSLSSLKGSLRETLFGVIDAFGKLDPWLERIPPFCLFATNLTLFATKRQVDLPTDAYLPAKQAVRIRRSDSS